MFWGFVVVAAVLVWVFFLSQTSETPFFFTPRTWWWCGVRLVDVDVCTETASCPCSSRAKPPSGVYNSINSGNRRKIHCKCNMYWDLQGSWTQVSATCTTHQLGSRGTARHRDGEAIWASRLGTVLLSWHEKFEGSCWKEIEDESRLQTAISSLTCLVSWERSSHTTHTVSSKR